MKKADIKASDLLMRAINRIAYLDSKTKAAVYDELGYSLGRQGGSAIQYWIYHHRIPSRLEDVENLARVIAKRGGWENEVELHSYLEYSGHPTPEVLSRHLLGSSDFDSPSLDADVGTTPAFIVGPPILQPHLFFGRNHELKYIFNALNGQVMQNFAIIGVQRSGKTSLLHYLRKITRTALTSLRPGQTASWLNQPAQYNWLYLDFQDPRVCTRDGFMAYILRSLGFPVSPTLDLVSFVDIFTRYINQPTVILLDEIQIALTNPEFTQQFWWSLRSLVSNFTDGRLALIMSAQRNPALLAIDHGRPSPFLNIFGHTLNLGPLTLEEALELINTSPIPFAPADVEWILQESGRWPALLQILCSTRLVSLEENQMDESWKAEARANIQPYAHLFETGV
jgi:hypothetical protein